VEACWLKEISERTASHTQIISLLSGNSVCQTLDCQVQPHRAEDRVFLQGSFPRPQAIVADGNRVGSCPLRVRNLGGTGGTLAGLALIGTQEGIRATSGTGYGEVIANPRLEAMDTGGLAQGASPYASVIRRFFNGSLKEGERDAEFKESAHAPSEVVEWSLADQKFYKRLRARVFV